MLLRAEHLQQRWHRYAEAEQLLAGHEHVFEQFPDMKVWHRLYLGDIYLDTNPGGALKELQEGEALANHYHLSEAGQELCLYKTRALYRKGEDTQAERACMDIQPGRSTPLQEQGCWRSFVLLTQADLRLMEWERQPERGELNPSGLLRDAERLLAEECTDHPRRDSLRLAWARTHLLAGQYADAHADVQHRLQETERPASGAAPATSQTDGCAGLEGDAGWLDLQGRVLLRRGDRRAALQCFTTLEHLARRDDLYDYQWRALIGAAEALEELNAAQAAQRYQEAEDHLSEWTSHPLGLGHASLMGSYELGTRRYVSFLLDAKHRDAAKALNVVRRARTRGLSGILLTAGLLMSDELGKGTLLRARLDHERARGTGDAAAAAQAKRRLNEELARLIGVSPLGPPLPLPPKLGPEEALFTCYPADQDHWTCFAKSRLGVEAEVVGTMKPNVPPDQLGGRLLTKRLLGKLAGVKTIRVLEYGAFAQVPFNELPLPTAGRSTARRPLVVYALDLPSPEPTDRASPREALLIIDPSRQHQWSRELAPAIRQRVLDWGWKLLGPDPAQDLSVDYSPQQVGAMLEGAGYFHFAGHGDAEVHSGLRCLLLGNGERLSAHDLLRLKRAPERAVLIGCRTGTQVLGPMQGLNLNLAWILLLRGSREVVATTRNIEDATAADLARDLYQRMREAPREGYALARALDESLSKLSTRSRYDPAELGAFRSYVW